jgi:hypothetical protein
MGRRKARLSGVGCTCLYCKNTFFIKKSELTAGRGKYCGPDCFSKSQTHVFSDSDILAITSEWESGEPATSIARKLGIDKQVLSRYLKKIGVFEKRYRKGSGHVKWKGGTSINGARAKEFRLRRGHVCANCGYRKIPRILEIHHIDRNRRNNEDINLLLLCPNCHAEEHYDSHTGIYTYHGTSRDR